MSLVNVNIFSKCERASGTRDAAVSLVNVNALVFRSRSFPCLCLFVFLCGFVLFSVPPAAAQDWFRTGTGLGVEKARVAVADFSPRSESSAPLAKIFSDVVSADLEFSGILEVVSRSFHPTKPPAVPADLTQEAQQLVRAAGQRGGGRDQERAGDAAGCQVEDLDRWHHLVVR